MVRIFVRGDEAVAYGAVLGVMGRIQAAGFERVALVAQLRNRNERSRDEGNARAMMLPRPVIISIILHGTFALLMVFGLPFLAATCRRKCRSCVWRSCRRCRRRT